MAKSNTMQEPDLMPEIEQEKKPDLMPADEKEEIFIPKGYANDDPNLFVSVNGKNYLLPKGKTSLVPKAVAAEIKRARRAQEKLDQNKDRMLNLVSV